MCNTRLGNYAGINIFVEHRENTNPDAPYRSHEPTGRYFVVINSRMGEVRLYKFFKEQYDYFMSRVKYLL